MNAWLLLVAIAVMAIVYIMIPVWLAASGYFRRRKLVRCPVVGLGARVMVTHAGLAEAVGRRSFRRISDCTFWPRRKNCAELCRLADDEFMSAADPGSEERRQGSLGARTNGARTTLDQRGQAMRIRAWSLVLHVPTLGIILIAITLIAITAMLALAPSAAQATPGFARQTGLSCQACHTVFPELTPFGRKFKLNAYVFTNVRQLAPITEQSTKELILSEVAPISVQLQASHTLLGKALPDNDPTVSDLSQKNTTEFPQALSLFYTGSISDKLGAFIQLTWNPQGNSVGIDNSDLRFADHGAFDSIGVPDFIYGLTLNNNPTSQDVWNSTPAWGFPFIVTNVGVPPVAKTLLDGQLAQESAGLGAYLYLFNHLYVEATGYRSAQTSFTNTTTGGPGPLDSTAPVARISGPAAPYWRVAWEQDWDNHALTVGTFGIWAKTHPAAIPALGLPGIGESGPLNTFTDVGVDVQYQFIGDNHIFSATGTWIREMRHFNNVAMVDHTDNTLNTARITGSYFFRRMIGGSAQLFSTTGTRDHTLYAAGTSVLGTASGSPDTQGAILELDFLPWLNTKLGAQYTLYSKFNGRTHDYDGAGRNASGNNTLFIYVWTAF